MRVRLGLVICLLGVATAALVPSAASACSCVATPIHRSDPADGAESVPLNQALMVMGVFAASSIELELSDGTPVPFRLNAGPWPACAGTWADVLPEAPLAANTRYVLRVEPLYPDQGPSSLSFTTGTNLLPEEPLEMPGGQASVISAAPPASCGMPQTVFACIDMDGGPGQIELIARRGDEILLRTTSLVWDDGAYGLQGVPDCIEMRRRAPTGQLSAPRKICGKDLKIRAWRASDSAPDEVLACEHGRFGLPEATADAGMASEPPPDTTEDAGQDPPDAGVDEEDEAPPTAAPEPADARSAPDASAQRRYGCSVGALTSSGASGTLILALLMSILARRRFKRR